MKADALLILGASVLMLSAFESASGQESKQVVQLARLETYPPQLKSYNETLKEGVEGALLLEPGVLSLNAMAEKENPTHITLIEVYADEDAYTSHLQTPHPQCKTRTNEMAKSLELVRMLPLFPGVKKAK